jgi:hypothetical protein
MNDYRYITERTKAWRSRDIKPHFIEALDMIEQYGCQIMSVTADDITPSFSYSTGVYDTCGKPEIITIGLLPEIGSSALNRAVTLMRRGIDLTSGRHRDLVGDVEVEFRSVDPKWLHHIMLRTNWFYEGADVPVLQLIYPDLDNRFPGEPEFNSAFEQPFLSGESEHGSLEFDLWATHDPSSSLYNWKFSDSPHASAYLSQTVFDKKEHITYVSHDVEDGAWQFLGDKMAGGGGPIVSCLHHPIDDDPTLKELADLPLGWYATRENSESPWQRFEHPPEKTKNETPSS